jgi:hypothetical protein
VRILRDLTAGGPGVCGINSYVIMPQIQSTVTLPLSTNPSYLNEVWTSTSPEDSLSLLTQTTCAAGLAVATIAAFSF